MSEYQEFTGKTVEEALKSAREEFGVSGLSDLDFEILTQGSRGVLGMGAEPARIIAAPRSALGGATPKKEAAEASTPAVVPAPRRDEPARESRPRRGKSSEGERRRSRAGSGSREASSVSEAAATEIEAAVAASSSRPEAKAEAEVTPEALEAAVEILETLVAMMGYEANVEISTGATAKISV